MTGHDPDDKGDDPADAGDDPADTGDDPADAGDDGAQHADEERPGDWPDDWTTADDDAHSPTTDSSDDAADESVPADGGPTTDPLSGDRLSATAGEEGDDSPDDAEAATALAAESDDPTPTTDAPSTLGDSPEPEKPPAPSVDDGPTIEDDGLLAWFRNTNNGAVVIVRDVVSSVAAVAAIGLLLFAISGIWPPLVAVESGSMEPHMSKGDLVFLVDEKRYAPQSAVEDTGVSTYQSAKAANGYSKFGETGDVIVYKPFGDDRRTPIIHRARFHVEKGENWVDDANPSHLGSVNSCAQVPRNMCPAPYDGFITKGDANPTYDQIGDQSNIVKDDWVRGKAEVRIPLLGWIRLQFAKLAVAGPSAFGPFGAITARVGAFGVAAGAAVVSTRL